MRNNYILTGRMPLFFIVTAYLCGLKLPVVMIVGVCSAGMVPLLIRRRNKEEEQKRKLEDSAFYMEQLIYSFRRHHKIPAALRDVSYVTEGNLKKRITEALGKLEGDFEEDNLFRQAFSHVEAQYGHHLMHVLHVFLIRVEEQGGDCALALELLLHQLRDWKKNQKTFVGRKKGIQSRLVLAIILSCLICAAVVRMMPAASGVADRMAYQVCTGTGLVVFQMLYIGFSTMSAGTGLEKAGLPSDCRKAGCESRQMEKLYRNLESPVHGIRYWKTVHRLEQEINIHFPEWMFDMILRLQTENVQTAVSHSLDDAPEVLVRPLYQLIKMQQEDPVSIQPYLEFLKGFNLPEIHAVMLQLYAINDMGKDEIQEQIYAMLDQNRHLADAAFEMKTDSVLSWMGMMAALPMLVSVIVLVVNLSLMLFSFLGEMYRL
ncbi:MAG: hypothetical protein PUG60_02990 [Lachnospiraceae bacterium]|nr:hypothetical protein [Lachnospiraceae bacterium]